MKEKSQFSSFVELFNTGVRENNSQVIWICLTMANRFRYRCDRSQLSEESWKIFELFFNLNLYDQYVDVDLSKKGKRMVGFRTYRPSTDVLNALKQLHQSYQIECLDIPFNFPFKALCDVASVVPNPHTIWLHSRDTEQIPNEWSKNVKNFSAQYAYKLTSLNLLNAEKIECYSSYSFESVSSIHAEKALRIIVRCCEKLTTIYAPKALDINIFECKNLRHITLPKGCTLTGQPEDCKIVYL